MKFFNIINHDSSANSAVIQIMDQIGYNWWTDKGVEATAFINEVRALGDLNEVFLEINSPGGNVYDGVSIANFIKNHSAKWTACVIGQAASIATVIASACDTIEMGIGTNYLVHKPMSIMEGYINADQCRALAGDLDTIENSVIDFYMPRIATKNKTKDELLALMKEDRVMSAEEALEWGFVDSQSVDLQAVAFVDAKQASKNGSLETIIAHQKSQIELLSNSPDLETQLKDLTEDQLSKFGLTAVELGADAQFIAQACTEAKVPSLINRMLDKKFSEEQVTQEINTVTGIQAVCLASNIDNKEILNNLADPAKMLSHAITEAIAQSELEQDPSLPSGVVGSAVKELSSHAIYEARNNIGK